MVAEAPIKHVFISYVRENSDRVDELCKVLEAVNIPYWKDRKSLAPGEEWKAKIREAIRSGSTFLACFSDESRSRDRSHMNEELAIATEEWRLRPPGRTWLIPVRFDEGPVPQWDLGNAKTLDDLGWSDLFGPGMLANTAQLIDTLKEVMGLTPSRDPESIQAAVSEASAADRPAKLRRLTKDMIRDTTRDIDLDDIISEEVARVRDTVRDTDRFPTDAPAGPLSELTVHAAEIANDYWHLVEPFVWSLQVAARYGTPAAQAPWVKGLKALTAEGYKIAGGHNYLLNLRLLPSLVSVFTAAMAASGQGKWENFKTLVVDAQVAHRSYDTSPKLALVEAVSPYKPFDGDAIPQLLANSVSHGEDLRTTQQNIEQREYSVYHTPSANWLHHILRPVFDQQFPDDEDYDVAFDATEVILGMIEQDLSNIRHAGQDQHWLRGTHWIGRSAWRSRRHDNPVEDFANQLEAQDLSWAPLRAGLFGGDTERAAAAISQYREQFESARSRYL